MEGSNLEKEPEYSVEILWGEEGESQKFVDLEDVDGNYYIYSLPKSEESQHIGLVVKAADKFKLSGMVERKGGGFVEKVGGSITIFGTSTMLGNFDSEKAWTAFEKAYPEFNIKVVK
ncbi:MAG TPA: hypothetical protein PK886_01815 [Candidatus Paceibacterota bacterium]|nr:hypothetical protein [Candidatus Paceibacterota bacterium]